MSKEAEVFTVEEQLNYQVAEAMFAVGELNKMMKLAGVNRSDRRRVLRAVVNPEIESVYVENEDAARDAIRKAQHELAKARVEV